MGMIYLAHDPAIDRKVAIKLIRADLLGGDERAEYVARFRHEAQAAGRCAHPNIVAVYDLSMHEGNPYLAMEYVEGSNLSQVLTRSGRFLPPDAVALIGQVLDALGCAHGLGIVHRDVKPANILLMADRQVKMTDFGISRLDTSALTQTGTVIGTPSYMSPEQCRGEPADARSDLFCAGVVLYELLSGARPFTGRNTTEIALQVMNQVPPDLGAVSRGLPQALIAAVERALAKRPEDRFVTAGEMAAALRQSLRTIPDDPTDRTVVLRHGHVSFTEGAQRTDESQQRSRFRQDLTGQTSARSAHPVPPALAQQGERELAVHMGPIARILAKRALEAATSPDDFWRRLASHIEREADRQAFLRKRH
jgi:serine/threonine protein kinase